LIQRPIGSALLCIYRNVRSRAQNIKVAGVARMLRVICAPEEPSAAETKSKEIAAPLKALEGSRADARVSSGSSEYFSQK
jgi:hypothetical protein